MNINLVKEIGNICWKHFTDILVAKRGGGGNHLIYFLLSIIFVAEEVKYFLAMSVFSN